MCPYLDGGFYVLTTTLACVGPSLDASSDGSLDASVQTTGGASDANQDQLDGGTPSVPDAHGELEGGTRDVHSAGGDGGCRVASGPASGRWGSTSALLLAACALLARRRRSRSDPSFSFPIPVPCSVFLLLSAVHDPRSCRCRGVQRSGPRRGVSARRAHSFDHARTRRSCFKELRLGPPVAKRERVTPGRRGTPSGTSGRAIKAPKTPCSTARRPSCSPRAGRPALVQIQLSTLVAERGATG